jgi:hypothetical protein
VRVLRFDAPAERHGNTEQSTRFRERAGTDNRVAGSGACQRSQILCMDDRRRGLRLLECVALSLWDGITHPFGLLVPLRPRSRERRVDAMSSRSRQGVPEEAEPGRGSRSTLCTTLARWPSARRLARFGSPTRSASSAIHLSVTNSRCLPWRSWADTCPAALPPSRSGCVFRHRCSLRVLVPSDVGQRLRNLIVL